MEHTILSLRDIFCISQGHFNIIFFGGEKASTKYLISIIVMLTYKLLFIAPKLVFLKFTHTQKTQTVYVCHIQSVSVTESLCLSEKFCVCHRQFEPVTASLCLSRTVCFCFKHSSWLFMTGILALISIQKSQKLPVCRNMFRVPLSDTVS